MKMPKEDRRKQSCSSPNLLNAAPARTVNSECFAISSMVRMEEEESVESVYRMEWDVPSKNIV